MELVVDTDVIFSALIAGGKTREIIIAEDLRLYVPEFFFDEFQNNLGEIEEKADIEGHELELLLHLLFEQMHVIPRVDFEDRIEDAIDLIADVDPDDVPFLALAQSLDADVWSDDEDFQKQDVVAVWRTHELVQHLL